MPMLVPMTMLWPSQFIGRADRLHKPRCQRGRRRRAADGTGEQDGELVAAKAGDHVVVAHAVAQAAGHQAQQIVAGGSGQAYR